MSNLDSFRTSDVLAATGLNEKTLHVWVSRGLVSPSVERGNGSGTRRRWSFRDVVSLGVAKHLRDLGVALEAIEDVIDYIERVPGSFPPADDYIVCTEGNTFSISGNTTLREADRDIQRVSRNRFSGPLIILPLVAIVREVRKRLPIR